MIRGCCFLVLLSVASGVVADDANGFRRWAIIASPELREAGVSDLLFGELAAKSIALVEREQLDSIAKEIELSKLLAADAAAGRLKVGRLTKADVLVLMSVVEHEKQRFTKVVVSDCRYGSRLRQEYVPFDRKAPDALAARIAEVVVRTRSKFDKGVQRLVAVSPLLSNNLRHDFDNLQFGFAAALGEALSQRPGLAVLEIEEARAIAQELTRSDSELESRRLPLVVEGEFEVLFQAGDRQRVRLVLKTADGKNGVAEFRHEAESPAAAARWLAEEFAPKLAADLSDGEPKSPGISPAEQREKLIARADVFAQAAAYPQSTALREAALLLDDSDWTQRVLLIGEYAGWLKLMTEERIGVAPAASVIVMMELDAGTRERMAPRLRPLWFALMAHLDRLAASDTLNPVEISSLLSWINLVPAHMLRWETLGIGLLGEWHELCWRTMERLRSADPLLRKGGLHPAVSTVVGTMFDTRLRAESEVYQTWSHRAASLVAKMPDRRTTGNNSRRVDDDTLANLDRFVNRVLRDDRISLAFVQSAASSGGSMASLVRLGRIPEAKLVELLNHWLEDERPAVSVQGGAILLGLKASQSIADTRAGADDELADHVRQRLVEWERRHPGQRESAANTRLYLDGRLKEIVGAAASRPAPRMRPRLYFGGVDPAPRLTFEPVPDVKMNWVRLQRCDVDLDLVWSWNRVALVDKLGREVEIFKTSFNPQPGSGLNGQDKIYSAAWDGEFVWVASFKSGLQVFARSGTRLGQFLFGGGAADSDAAALPPITDHSSSPGAAFFSNWNDAAAIAPLGAGRCFVTGRYGADSRQWFGCIEPVAGEARRWQYQNWHELKKAAPATPNRALDDDVDQNFHRIYFADYQDSSSDKRWLLIGRQGAYRPQLHKPLAFDARTGAVSIFPHVVGRGSGRELLVENTGIYDASPPDISRAVRRPDGGFATTSLPTPAPPKIVEGARRLPPRAAQHFPGDLVPFDDWIYRPGPTWQRIHRRSGDLENLTADRIQARFEFDCYASSARYGLVAWNYGDMLHRVHIDRPRSAETETDWLYPFVPLARRATHHAAVIALRNAGAVVDFMSPSRPEWHGKSPAMPRWRTVLCLTSDWKGGDEKLAHVRDLYVPTEIILDGADVTDEGLRALGETSSFESIVLANTKATNAGMSHLARLPLLGQIWLEPRPGAKHLGDDGLAAFAGHPKLRHVTLADRGFTDVAVEHLLRIPSVSDLRLTDTAITATGVAAIKKARPAIRMLSETGQ